MSHACPIHGCAITTLPDHLLMCNRHWRRVSRPLQRKVYRAYHDRDRGTAEALLHARLASEAIAAVKVQMSEAAA